MAQLATLIEDGNNPLHQLPETGRPQRPAEDLMSPRMFPGALVVL